MAARLRLRDATGALRVIRQIRMRDAAGVLKTIQRIRMRDAGNVLRTVFQYFKVDLSAATANKTQSSTPQPAFISTGAITSTLTGGTAAFTYAWNRLSGSAEIYAATPSASGTVFKVDLPEDGIGYNAVFSLTVTDATGLVAFSPAVSVNMVWNDSA